MDTKDGAFLAGIEKVMKELSFLLMGPTLELMKSLMQTTTVVCCLGKYCLASFAFMPIRFSFFFFFISKKCGNRWWSSKIPSTTVC